MGIISTSITLVIIILWLGWLSFRLIDVEERCNDSLKSQMIADELYRKCLKKLNDRITDIERGFEDDGR